jgi:hypothetical protein
LELLVPRMKLSMRAIFTRISLVGVPCGSLG